MCGGQMKKTISDEQIAYIKRIASGGTTSMDALARMYGLTEDQLRQVLES